VEIVNYCPYYVILFSALQGKLKEEKGARQRAEQHAQDKERQMSMLSVDYRQIQQRLQKLEGEHRQEAEKVKAVSANLEQEAHKKASLATELGVAHSEVYISLSQGRY